MRVAPILKCRITRCNAVVIWEFPIIGDPNVVPKSRILTIRTPKKDPELSETPYNNPQYRTVIDPVKDPFKGTLWYP